jgi:uncharacterized protein
MTKQEWPYRPPLGLRGGMAMTVYMALQKSPRWTETVEDAEPPYEPQGFGGANGVPLWGWLARNIVFRSDGDRQGASGASGIPGTSGTSGTSGTIIATYGITGCLEDQGPLRVLGRKAWAAGYSVLLFDWRAHGKTAQLSPTLTSDGLYEGDDFVVLAQQALALGCAPPFWFVGYSLGGQLALWGAKAAERLREVANPAIDPSLIGGVVALCPNLDADRSLNYLLAHPLGRYIERSIARNLKILATEIHQAHPGVLDPAAIERATTIRRFDQELVIGPLGFSSVEAYYQASSPLGFLPQLQTRTLIIYAADDPLFHPDLVKEIDAIGAANPNLDLVLTQHGGHVGYWADRATQRQYGDPDRWWAWNRALNWIKKG